jgi:taurine dioxygenase
VRLLSNADEFGAVGGSDEIDWHTNVSYQERCAAYTILNAVELPALGARPKTSWANLRQAFADLPSATASEIENYHVHYSQKGYQGRVAFGSSDKVPEAVNALVRTHPVTGERALYEIGKRVTVKILDLEQEESDRLMKELLEHATSDQYVYAHDWELGDTVVWDNLSTLHRREPWSSSERRVMRVIDVLEAAPSGSQPDQPLGQILPEDWVGEVAPEAV